MGLGMLHKTIFDKHSQLIMSNMFYTVTQIFWEFGFYINITIIITILYQTLQYQTLQFVKKHKFYCGPAQFPKGYVM